MLAVSAPDGLLPMQIEIAERIVGQFADDFRIAARLGKGVYYIFDLSGERAPGRLPDATALTLNTRSFGPGEAYGQADEMARFIEQHQVLPLDPSLGGAF